MRLIFIIMLVFTSTANAEVKIYNGTGEYIMSEFETLDIAKQRAKQKAERHAQEQAGVYVSSYTKVKNAQVSEDEIITITSGIMNVVDVDYEVTPLDKGKSIHIVAKIKANIDTDDINKWLAKGIEERSNLAAQNKELQKAIAEQDNQIAELKKQLADVKTQKEKDRITQEFANEDKIFLSNQKLEEAKKFYDKEDYDNALLLCNQAIQLNDNNEIAYYARSLIYDEKKEHYLAIADITKAIELNPNNIRNYEIRASSYRLFFKDYDSAIKDDTEIIKLNPNNHSAYFTRGMSYSKQKQYKQAISDFSKAIEIKKNIKNESSFDLGVYYEERGKIYHKLKNYELAIADYTKVIENYFYFHNIKQYYFYRALCYEKLENKEKSMADMEKVKEFGGYTIEEIASLLKEIGVI